jgi:hypothetical protein
MDSGQCPKTTLTFGCGVSNRNDLRLKAWQNVLRGRLPLFNHPNIANPSDLRTSWTSFQMRLDSGLSFWREVLVHHLEEVAHNLLAAGHRVPPETQITRHVHCQAKRQVLYLEAVLVQEVAGGQGREDYGDCEFPQAEFTHHAKGSVNA